MMRRHSTLTLTLLVVLVWGLGACGGSEDSGVAARDLLSGDVVTFASPEEVPEGYAICTDEVCEVPSDTPCEALGEVVCQEQPGCRLFPVWCTGDSTDYQEPPSPNEPVSPDERCEYVCISQELTCGELTDVDSCLARADCTWAEQCPACETPDGSECDCQPACVPMTAPVCEDLDQEACLDRSDCEWNTAACPSCPVSDADPASDCPCTAACQPASGGTAPFDPTSIDTGQTNDGCLRTGCNGEICAKTAVVSSCEWQESYLCYDLAICGMLEDGSCGWIPTEPYMDCKSQSAP